MTQTKETRPKRIIIEIRNPEQMEQYLSIKRELECKIGVVLQPKQILTILLSHYRGEKSE